LLYAATGENWKEIAELALVYSCPLTIFAPGDLDLLKSLARALIEYGVENLVLDRGTLPGNGLRDSVNNFTMIRRAACKKGDELLGFSTIAFPMTVWLDRVDAPE